ncbi:MAG: FimV/HubP family polar landmark protein [Xanthomonadales bacterium]|nr:FimV/HubP family polar landmark protein [Xanthomonadales bacterium]
MTATAAPALALGRGSAAGAAGGGRGESHRPRCPSRAASLPLQPGGRRGLRDRRREHGRLRRRGPLAGVAGGAGDGPRARLGPSAVPQRPRAAARGARARDGGAAGARAARAAGRRSRRRPCRRSESSGTAAAGARPPEPEPFELPAWEPEPLAAAPAETPPAADEDERITQRLARADLGIPSPFDTQRLVQADIDRAMADRTPAASGVPLAAESEDDVVATKLDLAREYLDLGDAEGARGLLEEVLAEGSPAQKAEAQRLLAQIR